MLAKGGEIDVGVVFTILLVVAALLLFKVVGSILGFVFMLFVAGLIGAAADAVVPGRLPYGWIGAVAAGLFGAWLGTLVMGALPPIIGGLPILPAVAGAIIVAFVVEYILKHGAYGRMEKTKTITTTPDAT
jgi:uncharacterized membrane protein YeaQ/YmgE (transglycosylase-associated protein family)